uniref:U-box domain-containing protein n=1 Tax=Oryza punctata TaxID=4537 RepID=A0A0E0LSM9_ORYPU
MSPASGPAQGQVEPVHRQHEPHGSISSAAPTSTDASIAAPPEAAADDSPPPPPPPPPPPSVGSRLPQQPGEGGGRGADGWSSAAAAVGQKGKKKISGASDDLEQVMAERDEERKSDSLGRRSSRAAYHGHAKEEARKLPWDDPIIRKEQVTPVSTIKKSHRTSALGCINNQGIDGLHAEERHRFGLPYVACNEFAVMWSLKDDEIWYPLFAEILGDVDQSIKSRKVWDDIRLVRKLRPLQNSEKISSRAHYKMILVTYQKLGRMPNRIYSSLFTEDPKAKDRLEGFEIPDNLVCPLCGKVMVDPVMAATGKTIDRHCIRAWFDKHGHICPVTRQPVSSIVLRNERIRGYLVEWHEAELEVKADARAQSTRP